MLNLIAATIFAILTFLIVAFQLALIWGAPWGELTLGGRYKNSLPLRIRIVPAISIILILGFTVVVLKKAGLAFSESSISDDMLIWVVVGYCAIGTILNAITPSSRERKIWLPVVVLMLICSLMVAL